MGLCNNQLPSHTSNGFRKARKFIKRCTSKKARYAGKRSIPTRYAGKRGDTSRRYEGYVI